MEEIRNANGKWSRETCEGCGGVYSVLTRDEPEADRAFECLVCGRTFRWSTPVDKEFFLVGRADAQPGSRH